MASLSILAQSRVKAGDSTVIVLTEAQFKQANKAFEQKDSIIKVLQDSTKLYKHSLFDVQDDFTKYQIMMNRNLQIVKDNFERERKVERINRIHQQVFTSVVLALAVFFAAK